MVRTCAYMQKGSHVTGLVLSCNGTTLFRSTSTNKGEFNLARFTTLFSIRTRGKYDHITRFSRNRINGSLLHVVAHGLLSERLIKGKPIFTQTKTYFMKEISTNDKHISTR